MSRVAQYRGDPREMRKFYYLEYNQKRRERFREEGVCMQCGRPRDGAGRFCGKCHEKNLTHCRQKRAVYIREGRCMNCGRPLDGAYKTCAICRARGLENYKRKREARIAAGLCPKCGGKADGGRRHCAACLDKIRKRHLALYKDRCKKGLCPRCGKPADRKTICPACYEKNKKYRAKEAKCRKSNVPDAAKPTPGRKECARHAEPIRPNG